MQLAQEELDAARRLCETNSRQAAYFCQQAAEKMARAILSDAGVPFGTGHNLGQMASALPQDHSWRAKLKALDKHSPAATRYRYPGPTGRLSTPPSPEQIKADIAELADLLAEATQFLQRA